MQVNNNNDSNGYNPVQHETSIKRERKGANFDFLELLWAGPVLAMIKFIPVRPKIQWTLFSITLAGAFAHGTVALNKSFNNFAEDDPNVDYRTQNNDKK
ncbi:hypothetical protein DICPUDRAFT_151876 [Dictyostelium purpureum]|uniref:Uncharacterized protein n=1 Tax=Dictyostelium purpureum TaxID=5786 RepID=F0ZJZ3_DICPU|nr:uncharacterized protein DICPUDRAFT_151876 [Dictyostelium purpureum]EGC35731.1 hypothetical protein DICPUDRAFT_151876 [Dictyostelium purpureum]|eukprot:XP_003287734.1 hypothetical protein DICPUDRAFT_151876 [Dictyostelium purpureum]